MFYLPNIGYITQFLKIKFMDKKARKLERQLVPFGKLNSFRCRLDYTLLIYVNPA